MDGKEGHFEEIIEIKRLDIGLKHQFGRKKQATSQIGEEKRGRIPSNRISSKSGSNSPDICESKPYSNAGFSYLCRSKI